MRRASPFLATVHCHDEYCGFISTLIILVALPVENMKGASLPLSYNFLELTVLILISFRFHPL